MQVKRRHVTVSVIGVAAMVAASLVAASGPAAAKRGTQAKSGGSITWALEAETSGGFCIPKAQLAAAGLQEMRAIYDSLTILNKAGKYVPYLAQSFTPNATFDTWTIKLRPGIKFQDGEPLDAAAVKLNIDSLRGKNPNAVGFAVPVHLEEHRRRDDARRVHRGHHDGQAVDRAPRVLRGLEHEHHGAGAAQRQGHLRDEDDRHRPVQARRVACQRVAHRRAQPRLLAQGLPEGRQDRLPAGHRRQRTTERARELATTTSSRRPTRRPSSTWRTRRSRATSRSPRPTRARRPRTCC